MDLSTKYLGLTLKHPFMMGASPWVDRLDRVRQLEDAGVSAIVMHSLFEEQLVFEQVASYSFTQPHAESSAEARSYLPEPTAFALGPDEYLEQLRRIKQVVSVPVIGSLNGITPRGWLEYARMIEQAGADALELNLYAIHTDPGRPAADIESEQVDMVRRIKSSTQLPVALKLSPYYSSLPHFVARACQAGADGFVIFNRFYQPDFDLEALDVRQSIELSSSSELLLRLRWLAILSTQTDVSLAVTGGVHSLEDAIKALMAGSHAVQLVSEILKRGARRFTDLVSGLTTWLEEHEYESLTELRGSMNLKRCPNPSAFERSNYMKLLQSWRDLSTS